MFIMIRYNCLHTIKYKSVISIPNVNNNKSVLLITIHSVLHLLIYIYFSFFPAQYYTTI